MDVIEQEFPELAELVDRAKGLLQDDARPEILRIFETAYQKYLEESGYR